MDRETAVSFYIRIMDKCAIPVRRFSPRAHTPEALREMLGLHSFSLLPPQDKVSARTLYVIEDVLGCRHMLLRLPDSEEILFIGPYVTERLSNESLMAISEQNGIEAAAFTTMRKYYERVALIPGGSMLTVSMQTLCEALFGEEENAYRIEQIHADPWRGNHETDIGSYDQAERRLVEERYEVEAQLMNEIAHGHSMRAAAIMSRFDNSVVEQRSSVPLRNFKNYLIICNTLMRKAVQQGGVHPLYIDRLSSSFAMRIESIMTMEEGQKLVAEITRKYCLLVRNHAMKGCSPLVRSVILAVDSDLTADLSLSAHAAALGVNASYLSALFRRETGQTLSDYVARARAEHAVFLLNTTHMQIQTIAQHCGIHDVNYFTRMFRRVMGKTPTEYRQQARVGVTHPREAP